MHRATRLCTSLLRASTARGPLKPTCISLDVLPLLVTCRHYSTDKGKDASRSMLNKVEGHQQAMAMLDNLREKYKPDEDRISMEQAETNMKNWCDEADDYVQETEFDKAIRSFTRVIDVELPEGYAKTVEMRDYTAAAYLGRAYCYAQIDKPNLAQQDYQHVIENWEDDPEAMCKTYYDRATLNYNSCDYAQALQDINKCLTAPWRKTDYGQTELYNSYRLRAHIYADMDMKNEAIADATWLLGKKKSIKNYMFRSNIYDEFDMLDEAKQDLDVADQMGADDPEFWFSKSLIYVKLPGGEKEATKALKKALRRDPTLENCLSDFPLLKQIYETIAEERQSVSLK